MNISQLTNYPELFSQVYWGNFTYKVGDDAGDQEIIRNRNDFVREFDIIKIETRKTFWKLFSYEHNEGDKLDHPEAYRTRTNGIVCIVSEYSHKIPESAISLGFKEYLPLYCKSATTFLVHFKNINEAKTMILLNDCHLSRIS